MKPMVYLTLFLMNLSIFTGSINAIEGEEITTQVREIKGKIWPEVTVKALIKTSSLEAAAIFAAYDYQKEYVPGLIGSEVVKESVDKDHNEIQVLYTLKMPWPLGNSKYIHAHELTKPAQDSYKVRWYMIESDSAESVEGYAIFSPHPENKNYTLLTYKNLVTPKSFFAGVLKKLMLEDVKKSIEAIRKTTENLVAKNPGIVKKYAQKIKSILSGKEAYPKKK